MNLFLDLVKQEEQEEGGHKGGACLDPYLLAGGSR